MAGLAFNDSLVTLAWIFLAYSIKLLVQSVFYLRIDLTKSRFFQIGQLLFVVLHFSIKQAIYHGLPGGCGIMKWANGLAIWYIAFAGHYYFQFVKLRALLISTYSESSKLVTGTSILLFLLYVATDVIASFKTYIDPDTCAIYYNGTLFDTIGFGIVEAWIMLANALIYFKLKNKTGKNNKWVVMQTRFLANSILSAVFLIVTSAIANIDSVTNDASQVLFMSQIVSIGYFSYDTAESLFETKNKETATGTATHAGGVILKTAAATGV